MDKRLVIVVPPKVVRVRLEDFLLAQFPMLSKMYLRETVKTGRCEVNGREENIGHRLRANDVVEIVIDQERGSSMRPDNVPLEIVFEDDHLIVVNKPVGMLAHPSHYESRGTLLNALVFHLNISMGVEEERVGGVKDSTRPCSSTPLVRPGLIHRLDKQTSGLMVVAKTPLAHRKLSAQFMKKTVEKRYLALVEGVLEPDDGTIEAPIGRFADLKLWSVKDDGKPSVTRFWVERRKVDTTLLELEPVTGRTNQLRIHCEHIGHPIVGDTIRGGREHERLCLHAFILAFDHPVNRDRLSFVSEAEF